MISVLHLAEDSLVIIEQSLTLVVVAKIYVVADFEVSAVSFLLPHQYPEESRFAYAVIAYYTDLLAFSDIERNSREQSSVAVTLGEILTHEHLSAALIVALKSKLHAALFFLRLLLDLDMSQPFLPGPCPLG